MYGRILQQIYKSSNWVEERKKKNVMKTENSIHRAKQYIM